MAGKEYQVAFAIGARLQGQFGAAFKSAQSDVTSLQNKIESLNRKQGDISAYQKQQRAVEQTRAKLELLQKQYENLRNEMGQNGEASASLKNAMLQKQLQIEKTTSSLEGQETKLGSMGNALNEAGVDTNNLAQASQSLAAELDSLKTHQEEVALASENMGQTMGEAASSVEQMLAAVGLTAALKAGYDLMKDCSQASIEFETGMAGVQRTVGGSQSFLNGLGESFKEMSTVIPITTDALTGIATTAGQLGVAKQNVESFTTVMAQLDTTTDLTAESAATMLAQFSNITGVTQYDRLGSVVAELGDATATTASKVVEMSQGMAASAHLAGMSATDIMGISAAVGSLGVEAQAGSTAMSTLINTLYKAVETGEGLNEFASVANMTAEQFKQAWGEDAAGALNSFIQGLNDTERNGKSAIVILDQLGINNVRQTKAILGLASAGSLLSSTVAQANSAWQQNTALSQKASVMYNTTGAKLTMAQNAVNNLKIAVGDALTPAISAGAAALTSFVQPIAVFIQKNPALIRALTAAASVIGVVVFAITAYAAVMKIAAAANALFVASIPGLNIIMGITVAIAALTAGIVALVEATKDSQKSMEELDDEFEDLNADFRHQSQIRSLCAEYNQLKEDLIGVSGAAYELGQASETPIAINITAEIAEGFEQMSADDFYDGSYVYLTAEAAEGFTKLTADEFCDGTLVTLTAKAGEDLLNSELLLDGTEVYLTAEAAEKAKKSLPADVFISDDGVVKLTPEAKEYLSANSFLLENSSVQLTPEIANYLYANNFLKAGTEVELSGKALKSIVGKDFMIGTDVYLSPEILKYMRAQEFISGDAKISIQGVPKGTITVDEYIAASDRVVELTANVSNLADVQQAISALQSEADMLKGKADTAKNDLVTAQTALSDMEKRQSELQARLTHAGTQSAKSEIQAAIEEQSKAIDEQRGKVDELESAYSSIATQYAITKSAADELSAKEERLSEIKAELANASDAVASSLSGESSTMDDQIEKVDQFVKAEQALIRSKIYENVTKQAKQYSDAVKQSREVMTESASVYDTWNRTLKYAGMSADEVNAAYQGLLKTFDEKASSPDFVPFGNDAMDAAAEIRALAYLMGEYFDDLQQYADGSVSFSDAFGGIKTNDSKLLSETEILNERVADYGDTLKKLQGIQNLFIQNLSEGVKSGALSAEEAYGLLSTSLKSVGADADTVRAAVEQLNAELKETPEDVAEATASAAEVNAAIQPILDQMNKLSESYTEVYESAYKSMEGQFKLFEKAPELTEESVDQMIKALESQADYMRQYTYNLQEAEKMGVTGGLLAQLSDGSKESAAYLAAIVREGDTTVTDLNTAFNRVEEGKNAFASTVAEMQTDFSSKMDSMQADLEAAVAQMDLSADAAAAGSSTVQAFADAAAGKVGTVTTAFAKVAEAAKNALQLAIKPDGYASGTENAERGFKMVGEKGPELVFFNGGEKVLDAQETAAYQRANTVEAEPVTALSSSSGTGGPHIEVKPVYNLSGNMDTGEVRSMLDEQTGRIKEMVEEALDEIESDRVRSVYS